MKIAAVILLSLAAVWLGALLYGLYRWDRGTRALRGRLEAARMAVEPTRVDFRELVLALLEERIGAEAFDRFVTLYMTERVTTTPELLGRLRIVAGAEVEQWFRAELARRPD